MQASFTPALRGDLFRRCPPAGGATKGQHTAAQQCVLHHPEIVHGQIGDKLSSVPAVVNMETGSLHTPGAKPCQPPSAVDKGRGKQPSARLQNPLDLPEHAIRLRQDVQGIGDDHRVEGLRRVGQMGGILDREVEA